MFFSWHHRPLKFLMGILDRTSRHENQQLCFRIVNVTEFLHHVFQAPFYSDNMAFSKALLLFWQEFLLPFIIFLEAYSIAFSHFESFAHFYPALLQGFDSLFFFSHNPFTKWVCDAFESWPVMPVRHAVSCCFTLVFPQTACVALYASPSS